MRHAREFIRDAFDERILLVGHPQHAPFVHRWSKFFCSNNDDQSSRKRRNRSASGEVHGRPLTLDQTYRIGCNRRLDNGAVYGSSNSRKAMDSGQQCDIMSVLTPVQQQSVDCEEYQIAILGQTSVLRLQAGHCNLLQGPMLRPRQDGGVISRLLGGVFLGTAGQMNVRDGHVRLESWVPGLAESGSAGEQPDEG